MNTHLQVAVIAVHTVQILDSKTFSQEQPMKGGEEIFCVRIISKTNNNNNTENSLLTIKDFGQSSIRLNLLSHSAHIGIQLNFSSS